MNEQTIQALNDRLELDNHIKCRMSAQYNKDQIIYELAQLISNVTTLPDESLSEQSKDTEYAAYETLANLLVYLQHFMSQLGVDPEILNSTIWES